MGRRRQADGIIHPPLSLAGEGQGEGRAVSGRVDVPSVAVALALAFLLPAVALAEVSFRHPLDNQPITVPLPEGGTLTEAVRTFHETGTDPYIGQAEAVAAGKAVYDEWCQACHMPNGSGRMGPSFLDEDWNYPRTKDALGKFEVIWAGATGAMQSFKDRLSQDQILQVIAYIEELRARRPRGEEQAEGK